MTPRQTHETAAEAHRRAARAADRAATNPGQRTGRASLEASDHARLCTINTTTDAALVDLAERAFDEGTAALHRAAAEAHTLAARAGRAAR